MKWAHRSYSTSSTLEKSPMTQYPVCICPLTHPSLSLARMKSRTRRTHVGIHHAGRKTSCKLGHRRSTKSRRLISSTSSCFVDLRSATVATLGPKYSFGTWSRPNSQRTIELMVRRKAYVVKGRYADNAEGDGACSQAPGRR